MESNCENCLLRLYNNKGYNVKGVGSTAFGNMIIVPYVDKLAYKYQNLSFENMVMEMKQIIVSSTGEMLLDYVYVTAFIKCNLNKFDIDNYFINNCISNLKQEFVSFNPTKILLLGSEVTKYFLNDNININKVCIDGINRLWFSNYNPSIINYNPEKAEDFKRGLIKWFNAVKNNNFYGYER